MRIGIDAYVTSPAQGGFISYVSRIVEHLSAMGKDELLLYVPSDSTVSLHDLEDLPGVTLRPIEFDMRSFASRTERDTTWHQKALLGALGADRPDVCLGTAFFLPLDWDGPSVVTVHDTIFERHPEFFTPANLALYKEWGRRSAEKANAIITVSRSAAEDVADYWGIVDKPVVATPLGPALPFVPADRVASGRIVAEQLGIDRPYVLNVASGHPRKNLEGCIRAFAALPERLRRTTTLLLVNLDSPWVHDLVQKYEIVDSTVVTGRLPADLIPHAYAAATALVHPSFHEGFGLPVLEAMTCGTPVVSSVRPSIPEVAGDAAILVDPDDHEALAGAVERVLDDDALRQTLSAAGLERSKGFDWAMTAAATRDVLTAAAGS